jgi:hypothetical protein
MPVIVPPMRVETPQPLGRRPGLFTAAVGPLDLTSPHGQGGGVQFEETSCGTAYPYPINCDGEHPAKPTDAGDGIGLFPSFNVIAGMVCGALGYTEAEFRAKILQRLENGEQHAAELALWTGETPDGTPLLIPNLSDADVVDVSAEVAYDPEHLASVVSALEQWMYGEQGYNYTAFIHAPIGVAAWGNSFGELVIRDGNRFRTPAGSVWVFGGGYPADEGLRITGTTTVYRAAEPFVFPPDQTMDRVNNQRHLVAEREYAIAFECAAGSAEFNPLGEST